MSKLRFYIVGFLILLTFDTVAQLSFKFAGTNAAPAMFDLAWMIRVFGETWTYVCVACYLGAFVTWMSLLKHAPVGPAFAASHLEVVTVMIVSVVWLGDHLSVFQVLGSLLIIGGIFVFAVAEAELEHRPDLN